MPMFSRLNPSFLETISADMSRLSREQEAADRQFVSEAASVLSVPVGEERLRIDAERLRNMPDPEWLLYRLLEPYGFTSPVCSDLCSLIGRQGTFSGKVFHSEAFRAVTSGTSVIVVREAGDARISVRFSSILAIFFAKWRLLLSSSLPGRAMPRDMWLRFSGRGLTTLSR